MTDFLPTRPVAGPQPVSQAKSELRAVAEKLEAGFLAEMLKSAGVAEKERLIDALNAAQDRQHDLGALQAKVVRNQGLLDSALLGIRSVAARMATYRQVRKSMDTYDGQGRKHTIPGEVARTVQKRA